MTDLHLCDNATWPETRITPAHVWDRSLMGRRTITYWGAWDPVLASCRQMKDEVGSWFENIVVFNTEASGTDVNDIDTHCQRLSDFLRQAGGTVDWIEPGNELDTPSWGISDELIIEVGKRCAEVCDWYGVRCSSPSLLSGPAEGRFEHVADELSNDRFQRINEGLSDHVDCMALHTYYCSVYGQPWDGWRFGRVEDKIEQALSLGAGLPLKITELGCPVTFDGVGLQGQANFMAGVSALQHDMLLSVSVFCQTRQQVPEGEMMEGKDWYMLGDEYPRPAWLALHGGGGVVVPPLPDGRYQQGFLEMYNSPGGADIMGEPAEPNEAGFGPVAPGCSFQLTERGLVFWADIAAHDESQPDRPLIGARDTKGFFGHDGGRYWFNPDSKVFVRTN